MTEFEPVASVVGGALIGLAASLLLLANGRVAGVSGIFGRALVPTRAADRVWRTLFLVGLPLGAGLSGVVQREWVVEFSASWPTIAVAGALVGFGTQLGNGCTSGHGVCGIARGSRRSLAATATFMGSAALVVYLVRHVFA